MPLQMLRTSERADYLRCRQRWWWGYIEGLRRPGPPSPALRFGDLGHRSLEAFYIPGRKRGPKPAITFKKLYREQAKEMGEFSLKDADDPDGKYNAGEMGVDIFEGYFEKYGYDEDIAIIAPELPSFIKMTDIGGRPFMYVSKYDALGLDVINDQYFLFEHKTGSDERKGALGLDEQAGSYWATAPEWIRLLIKRGIIKQKSLDLDYILYNFIRKTKTDDRPRDEFGQALNKNGTVSKRQPVERFERIKTYRDEGDARTLIRRIRQQAWEMQLVRDGKLPVYKNTRDSCSWDCGFRDMCELHETGADWKTFRDNMFIQSNSYADYERDYAKESNGRSNKKRKVRGRS
jgi:hypothetical protein